MSENNPESIKASPVQAAMLLNWVDTTTAARGTHFNHCDSFGSIVLENVPLTVADHFPAPVLDAEHITRDLYVTRERDPSTNQPRMDGVVASLLFSQNEQRAEGNTKTTSLNYQVIDDGTGILKLERESSSGHQGQEHVPNIRWLYMTGQAQDVLLDYRQALEASLHIQIAADQIEGSLGIRDVTHTEAQQIIDFCVSL
jgi:hypothetical protein